MRSYETVFILTPVLSDKQTKESINKYRKYLKQQGAEITHEEDLGTRNLAYPIQNKNSGHYYLIEFNAPPTLITALNTTYKRDERIIRHLSIQLNKHAQKYNEQRRTLRDTQPSPEEQTDKQKTASS